MLPRHLRPIRSLMIGTALLLLGNGLLSTLLALRGSLEGYSDEMLGLMGSAYFVGFFVGTYVVPRMIRHMGHIRAFNFFAAGIAAIVLLHSLIVDPWVWLSLRIFTGIALVGFYTVIESWLNSQTAAERRGQVFAFYMIVNLVALAAAQQFLHFASPETFVLFSISAMMVCFSVMPVAQTRLPQPAITPVPRLTVARLWLAAPAAVVGALASGLTMGTFWALAPLYANRLGFDAGGVAMLMTTAILGGAALQWPLGHFSDRGDRRYALGTAAGGAALAAMAMAAVGGHAYALLGAAFLYGGMAFAIYPIVVAHLVDHLSHEDILSGNAGILLLHGLGAVAGPALVGALMGIGGPAAMPAFFAAILGPMALYVLLQARRTKDEIVEEPAHFVPMVRTAATAMEIAAAVEEHHFETAVEAVAEATVIPATEAATGPSSEPGGAAASPAEPESSTPATKSEPHAPAGGSAPRAAAPADGAEAATEGAAAAPRESAPQASAGASAGAATPSGAAHHAAPLAAREPRWRHRVSPATAIRPAWRRTTRRPAPLREPVASGADRDAGIASEAGREP
ncbi:MAG TPA: MFS transporter [Rhodocyclaceae bacterium]|nr:MFS transporter [Rhodocyclaceae bacterium]